MKSAFNSDIAAFSAAGGRWRRLRRAGHNLSTDGPSPARANYCLIRRREPAMAFKVLILAAALTLPLASSAFGQSGAVGAAPASGHSNDGSAATGGRSP